VPKTTFLSAFKYNETSDTADATVSSTFRFPGSNKINIQCDIVLCQSSRCPVSSCGASPDGGGIKSLPQIKDSESAVQLLASTSVFVVEPGESSLSAPLRECTEWRFPWLIGLCICLAILLLVMLIVNIFLCSSLTCTCTKTEVEEKEPSGDGGLRPLQGKLGAELPVRIADVAQQAGLHLGRLHPQFRPVTRSRSTGMVRDRISPTGHYNSRI
ncbi:hypothetical protein MTO96_051630, partial [Rhipicephalus appendiculatus]